MNKKLFLLALLAIVFSFAFSGCSEDSPNVPDTPTSDGNYYIKDGKRYDIKFAAMGYASIPTMSTALLFSIKDSNDSGFMEEENLMKFEIRENFLGFVKEGEADEYTKKSEFILVGGGINIGLIKGYEGLELDYSFKKVGRNPQGVDVYEIKFKATAGRGTKDESVIEFRYKGTLKTGGTGDVYEDDLSKYTEGGKITNPAPQPQPQPQPELESFVSVNGGKKQALKFAAMGYSKEEGMKTDIVLLGSSKSKDIKLANPSFIITVPNNIIDNPDDLSVSGKVGLKSYNIKIEENTRAAIKLRPSPRPTPRLRKFDNDYPNGSYVVINKVATNGTTTVYDIIFKFIVKQGSRPPVVVEGRYRGTLKTGGTGNVYKDDLKTYTEGGKITTPEPEPEPQPEPEPDNNYIQFEITPEGNKSDVTYPFIIEGINMFLDKNLNGVKDSGEEISDNFDGDLSMPKKDGKALFVLRGDVKRFKFKDYIDDKYYYEYPKYAEIKESKLDASKCATLEEIKLQYFGLTSINLSGCKALKRINVWGNKLKTLDLKGMHNLEEIRAGMNYGLSGKYDFSSFSKLRAIEFNLTNVSGVILPNSKSCRSLSLQSTPVESVDFSNGENIGFLSYGSEVSTSLDITLLNKILDLNLYGNKELTKLIDKSPEKKVKLRRIVLNNSPKLKEYDLSKYENLEDIVASYNIGVDVNTLISRLPNRKGKKEGMLELSKTDAEKVKNNQVLKDKNWKVKAV
ncbi:MAG: hypothetical protein Q3992_00265 [Bacteroides sp.]|nr:hypothetical protein [Bacteroides sp.]